MNEFFSSATDALRAWYFISPSSALKPGRLLAANIAGREIVLYRGESGRAYALAAHCSHMGTHLAQGEVIGDCVRCPLHHWSYQGDGRRAADCDGAQARRAGAQQSFPVAERHGLIFVFNAPRADFPPPEFSSVRDGELATLPGKSAELDCAWQAVVANAFDSVHFRAVHEREIKAPASITHPLPHCLRVSYVFRVTGRSLADRAMQWISRDNIGVTITCWGGPVLLAESDLGRARSALILCLNPVGGKVRVTPIFAAYRSGFPLFDRFRLLMANWLFGRFLHRDVAILNGIRFRPAVSAEEDPVLHAGLAFMRSLPTADTGAFNGSTLSPPAASLPEQEISSDPSPQINRTPRLTFSSGARQ